MLRPLSLDRKPGLPPDGSPGQFLGWDSEGWPYLFWWSRTGKWWGTAKDKDHNGSKPFINAPRIVSHALVRREEEE